MLSKRAQSAMAEAGMSLEPPGSATATFEVGEPVFYGPDSAKSEVATKWRDVDSNGRVQGFGMRWKLRYEDGRWAITGFTAQVFDDLSPVVMNFEHPQQLQETRRTVDAELAHRAKKIPVRIEPYEAPVQRISAELDRRRLPSPSNKGEHQTDRK